MTTTSWGHHTIDNRYRFEGRLELLSPLRLSSGRASDVTDAPLMRDRSGTPYIPGSSLRGVLRSELEKILNGLQLKDGPRSCILFSEDACCLTTDKARQDALREKPENEVLAALQDGLCDVCKLFGSPLYASRLVIEDACPEPMTALKEKSMVRDGVGIDRDTGAARENVKFNYEVLETGPAFTLRMQVENLGQGGHDRMLLRLALGLLQEGLNVGGKRAAGLGRILLKKETLKVTGFRSAQDLWKALQEGRDPHGELNLEEVLDA